MTECFRCDGSGEICDECGETEVICPCGAGFQSGECPDCGGTGK